MLLGMLHEGKMKQIEDMSSSARAIALTASTAGTGILMFTKARSDVASGVTGPITASRPASSRVSIGGRGATAARACRRGLDHGTIDEVVLELGACPDGRR